MTARVIKCARFVTGERRSLFAHSRCVLSTWRVFLPRDYPEHRALLPMSPIVYLSLNDRNLEDESADAASTFRDAFALERKTVRAPCNIKRAPRVVSSVRGNMRCNLGLRNRLGNVNKTPARTTCLSSANMCIRM